MRRISPLLAALSALPALAVTVEVDEQSAGMGTVSYMEKAGSDGLSTLTLRATAAAGCAFSGWMVDGAYPDWDADARNPSLSGVRVATNAEVVASFVDSSVDVLQFDVADVLSDFACGESVNVQLNIDSLSFPTLSFQNLPPGLSYNDRTLVVSGVADTPCVNKVVVTGVNRSGFCFSQSFDSQVGDKSSERIYGGSSEIGLGEYFHAKFDEMFTVDGETRSTSVAGIPAGLTWNPEWSLLYGTPRTAGVYFVKALARFADGKVEEATYRLTVSAPDPDEYGVDLSGLGGLSVGDVLASGDVELGTYSNRVGIVSVSGLPDGLEAETWVDGGVKHYGVAGTVSKAGVFTVKVGVVDWSGGSPTNIMTSAEVVVSDTPWRYFKVLVSPSSPPKSGNVSGGGALPVVSGSTVTAAAARGFVFGGWCDVYDEPAEVGEGVDFRTPSLSYGPETDFEAMELFALFVPAEQDLEVSVSDLDGESFEFDADGSLYEEFSVESVSFPSLAVKGLPPGVSISPAYGSAYGIVYDSETAARRPSPGRYEVVLTAKNKSGASASATFLLTVSNLSDPRVDVEDDYGELAPGEEIDPIDLSDAVDFAKGETISVSGLPRGLSFSRTANTITGTPTAPGYYTLTFTAKVVSSATTNAAGRVSYRYDTAKATAFITVLPWPLLSIDMDEDAAAAGNTVSGGGNYKPGTKVTLKAKAAKGWVFAGWDGLWDVEGLALLNPSLAVVTDYEDLDLSAKFVPVSEDMLVINQPTLTGSGFAAEFERGVDVADGEYASLVLDLTETVSWPTVKVSGLPSGVKFNANTLLFSGKPTKAGVCYATVSARNAGGYSFTRILRLAVVEPGEGPPGEPVPVNEAGVDFSPLSGLVTGTFYAPGDIRLEIGPSPDSGEVPTKATVSGAPDGLKASVVAVEGGLALSLSGTPTKVARYAMTVKVTYADRKTLTSKAFAVLEDGGSAYLDVRSLDESLGTVSGTGVYSAGGTVKLAAKPKAKCVFAGWFADTGGEEPERFAPLAEVDGFDFRTPSVAFPFRPGDFSSMISLVGAFAASSNDAYAVVAVAGDVWEIDPVQSSEFAFSVDSLSLPTVTAKNLPKGVSIDLARRKLVYAPTDAAKSGIYAATLTAKNQSRQAGEAAFEIRVANRTTEMIGGVDPDMDAYRLTAGVAAGEGFLVPTVADGVKLTVAGLPSGLAYKNGEIVGIPTKSGVYTVTFTAASGSSKSRVTGVATATIRVDALPDALSGTFSGFLCDGTFGYNRIAGTISATITAAGKISASVKTAAGSESFAAGGWDSLSAGCAEAAIDGRNGSRLDLSVDMTKAPSDWQLVGECKTKGVEWNLFGQRNAPELAEGWVGNYASNGLTVSVLKTGAARLSGKYEGTPLAGSSVLMEDSDGGIMAVFVVFSQKLGVIPVVAKFDDESKEVVVSVFRD